MDGIDAVVVNVLTEGNNTVGKETALEYLESPVPIGFDFVSTNNGLGEGADCCARREENPIGVRVRSSNTEQ